MKIYLKPTNTFSFPLGNSYMPTQIHRSITIGEVTRLLRNTENPSIYKYYRNKLIKQFARRKYPKRVLMELRDFTHDNRLGVLYRIEKRETMERPRPFTTRHKVHHPFE